MVTSKAIFPALAVVLTIASTSSAISIAQARAPAAASNTTSTTTPASTGDAAPVYIACVVDTALASLTTSETVQASSRAECSTGCASSTTNNWDLAFFRQDTSECRCALAADAPGSDDVVYAVDEAGNCRTQDDASVEYLTLASPYTLSTCYIPPLSAPTNGSSSTAPTAIGCFDFCYHSSSTATGAITVRPAYDDDKDIFEYECGCYASLDAVGGHQKMDCGFGIASIYVAA